MKGSEELPEGWTEVTLEALADDPATITYGVLKPGPVCPNGVPMLRVKDIVGSHLDTSEVYRITPELDAEYRRTKLRGGEVVISVQGSVGRVAIVPASLAGSNISRTIAVVRPVNSELTKWIWLGLQSPGVQRQMAEVIGGTTRDSLNIRDLRLLPLRFPPLAEQRRVVAAVEAVQAKVNAARDRLNRVPAILTQFRQSVLSAACSGRLTADWRERNPNIEPAESMLKRIRLERAKRNPKRANLGETRAEALFELPEYWEWVTWHDLVDWVTYGFTRPMPHVTQGIPIVTAKNIDRSQIEFGSSDFTTAEAYAELSEKDRPRRGEILLTKDGSIGRAAIVETDQPFCINQSVAILRFGGLTGDVSYLLRAIEAPFTQHLIDEGAKGSAIRHISITAFARFSVPLPPLAEQQEIVRRVDALFKLADRIEAKLAAAKQRVDALTQAVLAKAFRGELVPTEAELARRDNRPYEPAADLLARIRAERQQAATTTPRRSRKPRFKES